VYYKENGDKVEKTEWHRYIGENSRNHRKYVTKGKEVAIEGKLRIVATMIKTV
jgi:single-strand DNA-binding protein